MFAALTNWGNMRLSAFHRESLAVNAFDGRLGTAPGDVGQTLGIAEDLVQIAHRAPVRITFISKFWTISHAATNFFRQLVRFFAEEDGIAVRLGHLASIEA